jgi:hypothetical protein
MLTVINFLILFFILLITFQIILAYSKSSIIEGMMDVVPTISPSFTPTSSPSNEMLPNLTINQVYRQYDKKIADNTFLMSQQNAGNIEYLKQRIDAVQGIFNQVQDLSGNVQALQDQVNGLVTAQQDYATQMTGGVAPDITGATTPEGSEPVDASSLVTE